MTILHVVSYNIHKGFSQFNRRLAIHDLRDQLRLLDPDLVFLQEVQGQNLYKAKYHTHWPAEPQHEFLAEQRWHTAYGGNASYAHGHHGNAILSRWPLHHAANHDISQYRLERRGLLHCATRLPKGKEIHLICVHLSLTESQRRRQIQALVELARRHIPFGAPLIIAGDFNDWRNRASQALAQIGLAEVFITRQGKPARSYPSKLPMLPLDRIYVRGLRVADVRVHAGLPWSRISDHAVLDTQLEVR